MNPFDTGPKTPVNKNTDNERCVWCGRPTVPLFHSNKMRYCPRCEQQCGAMKDSPKKNPKIELDDELDRMFNDLFYDPNKPIKNVAHSFPGGCGIISAKEMNEEFDKILKVSEAEFAPNNNNKRGK